jgi:hypothetical protein
MWNLYDPEDFLRDGVTSVDMSTLPEGDNECTICCDHFASSTDSHVVLNSDQGSQAELPGWIIACNHMFGERCLRDHVNSGLSYSSNCPMCRRPLSENIIIGGPRSKEQHLRLLFSS